MESTADGVRGNYVAAATALQWTQFPNESTQDKPFNGTTEPLGESEDDIDSIDEEESEEFNDAALPTAREEESEEPVLDDIPLLTIPSLAPAKPRVWWFFGRSGVGKTKAAYEELKDESLWISSFGRHGKWLGYNFEKAIILDSFNGEIEHTTLLRLFDWYPLFVDNGEEVIQVMANNIIVTSLRHPLDVINHHYTQEERYALIRRIDKIVEFKWSDDKTTCAHHVDEVVVIEKGEHK
jgi:hypothetical protein